MSHLFQTHVQYVKWAIQRMTDDYSLRDIAALLEREGRPMGGSEISVVLTRMKCRGEIQEITRGHGPIPAVFRKPENAISLDTPPSDLIDNSEPMTASAAAA